MTARARLTSKGSFSRAAHDLQESYAPMTEVVLGWT